MQEQSHLKPLIFVYFRLRGKMQPIRNLICHLGLPFFEVHIDDEQQKKNLSEEIKGSLRGLKIDKSSLPLLVYEGHQIYETFPIMNYICRRFNSEELMGRDIKQRARVNEMLDLLLAKEGNIVGELFRLAEQSLTKSEADICRDKVLIYQRWINESGYIAEVCDYLTHQDRQIGFIFGGMTLLDFFFLQSCHYMLGVFLNLLDKDKNLSQNLKKVMNNKELCTMKHFRTIQAYTQFMEKLPFYQTNHQYLESFSIVGESFSQDRKNGLKKIWSYHQNFIQ